MIRMLACALRDAALETLYPQECAVCGKMVESWSDGICCRSCWEEVERLAGSMRKCSKCGLLSYEAGGSEVSGVYRCRYCAEAPFEMARACGPYEGAIRESVLRLKRRPQLPGRLAGMLRVAFDELSQAGGFDAIVPVPLHRSRLEARGFNQAEVIASELSSLTGLMVARSVLVRDLETGKHRAGMGIRERERSIEGAFRVRAPRTVRGRRLLLVDDVMTTGSTARGAARKLVEAGAAAVSVLCLARAVINASQP